MRDTEEDPLIRKAMIAGRLWDRTPQGEDKYREGGDNDNEDCLVFSEPDSYSHDAG
jgi:hypothetical protein